MFTTISLSSFSNLHQCPSASNQRLDYGLATSDIDYNGDDLSRQSIPLEIDLPESKESSLATLCSSVCGEFLNLSYGCRNPGSQVYRGNLL